ncbi:hypothetical protein KBD69_02125, partial [Candidatus Woesebacteria bacterium]|nr:hypothetical protein [Candidatus Woesebacteria bacterium]
MKHNHHDHWLFVIICLIGIVSLLTMGGVNLYIGNYHIGVGELIIGGVGVINLLTYLYKRNLDQASHVVLSSMFLLLAVVMLDGGIKETGWLWVFVFPTLAFAIRSVRVASWYVSLFGFYLAAITICEFLGLDFSVYGRTGLTQLCAAYSVVSAMLSFSE